MRSLREVSRKSSRTPTALDVLRSSGFATDGLRSKSWSEFAGPDAPAFDLIITVCDNAAGESCPVWPGHPIAAHWGIEDPAAGEGEEQRQEFERALRYLHNRVSLLVALPMHEIDELGLRTKLREIGSGEGASASTGGGAASA